MNGPQDMGGRSGFGPVAPDPNEPLFHADWEKRSLALTVAMGAAGVWTIDQSRSARESLPAPDYVSFPYYRIWFEALSTMIRDHGLATGEEIASGKSMAPGKSLPRILTGGAVTATLAKGAPADRPAQSEPAFAIGDAITTRLQNPSGHTRLPGYAMGRPGVVTALHGFHVFPDASSQGRDEAAWLYSVTFAAADLWGPDTTASEVSLDLWEPYLVRR